jgi:hypothetical protein
MMMKNAIKKLTLAIIFIFIKINFAFAMEIAITIDDLPANGDLPADITLLGYMDLSMVIN